MNNIVKASIDIGRLIRVWGDLINHRTYRDICDELASLVESADGDIAAEEYTDWRNKNISPYEEG